MESRSRIPPAAASARDNIITERATVSAAAAAAPAVAPTESPPPISSGAQTPPHPTPDDPISSSSPTLATPTPTSSYFTMFTGLMRRFSSEEPLGAQIDNFFMGPPAGGAGAGAGSTSSDAPATATTTTATTTSDGVHGVFQPAVKRTISPFRPPPLDPLVLHGYKEGTPRAARLLTNGIAEEIRTMIPERLRITEDWRMVYSLEQDGASLATLYQKSREYEGTRVGFVLVVKDAAGGTFGAYLSEYPRPAAGYFGNGECFLWRASLLASLPPPPSADTTLLTRNTQLAPPPPRTPTTDSAPASRSPTPSESIRFKAFPYSGLNDFCVNCDAGYLSVGSGGGHYGLWLDDSLDLGHSSPCETFGNEPLSDEGQKFGVLGVELWVVGS